MEFRCRLGTPSGEIVEGVFVAQTEAHLRRELEEKGLHVLALRPRGIGLPGLSLGARKPKIARHEFLVFNQELATLLKAGMPLVQSLDILRSRLSNAVFKAVLDDVHEKVRAGTALSDAFQAHGDLFPSVYTASLMAGERAGNLDAVLRRYVAYSKVVDTVRKRTISALVYPVILIGLAVVLVGVIVLKVVPTFSDFYSSFDAQLPLSTRAIVAISDVVRGNLVLIVVAALAVVTAFYAWVKQPGQRARFDRLVMKVPVIGASVHKFATAQLARTLGTLLGGGIPLVNALEIASRSTGNRHMGEEMSIVALRVREGQGFAATLLERKVVPDVAIKMIEVGESTGALQEMLNSLADFYDEEIETDVGRFVTIIEPALLIIMGIIIAVIVLALYLPLFELSSVIGAQ
ncbi:MAG TPA: type II secretion system F family protein [Vicinamibacterales bacterium]|nr:type II secretion system F family protein [Vicinamibacterales bacterium]